MTNLLHTTIGSNQYKDKHRVFGLKTGTWKSIWMVTVPTMIISIVAMDATMSAKASVTPGLISPLALYDTGESSEVITIMITPSTREYIKTIFGRDWRTAYAIARAESGLKNEANLMSDVENSVGVFQINIESATTKIHWSRIPGDTLEEKKIWLQDPFNNTLLAYWIYSTSGWNPWTAYTSGSYKTFL